MLQYNNHAFFPLQIVRICADGCALMEPVFARWTLLRALPAWVSWSVWSLQSCGRECWFKR